MAGDCNGTVLIVEDERELRFILAANLKAAGFAVLEAEDGAKAIELANTRHVDLIIMDIGVPVLDGISRLSDAVLTLSERRIAIDDISLRRPTLDEVFLTLTGDST